jgi:hypothetical protein
MSDRSVRITVGGALAALIVWGAFQPEPGPEEGIEWWAATREARRADTLALLAAMRDFVFPAAMASSAPSSSPAR